jgi:hypothetical protein
LHDIFISSKLSIKNAQILLQNHNCDGCDKLISIFEPYVVKIQVQQNKAWYNNLTAEKKATHLAKQAAYKSLPLKKKIKNEEQKADYWAVKSYKDVKFPPSPLSADLCQKIIFDFCNDTSPETFVESGCAVCGKLTPNCEMEDLTKIKDIELLAVEGVTRMVRTTISDPIL